MGPTRLRSTTYRITNWRRKAHRHQKKKMRAVQRKRAVQKNLRNQSCRPRRKLEVDPRQSALENHPSRILRIWKDGKSFAEQRSRIFRTWIDGIKPLLNLKRVPKLRSVGRRWEEIYFGKNNSIDRCLSLEVEIRLLVCNYYS